MARRSRFLGLGLGLVFGVSTVLAGQTIVTGALPISGAVGPAPNATDGCGPDAITQSTNLLPDGTFLGCFTNDANMYHGDNSWWRAFRLADHGLTADFQVCAVEIGVDVAATPGAVGQPLTINLYTSDCAFPFGTLTPIGTATVVVADQAAPGNLFVAVAGLAPALSELVVEIHVDDGQAQMQKFFAGGNQAGQTATSYFSSDACSIPDPIDAATITPLFHLTMNVIGTEDNYAPTAISVGGGGVVELGVSTGLAPSWTNLSGGPINLVGNISNLTGPGGLTFTLLDVAGGYGTIAPGSEAVCTDCYAIQIDGTGFGHRDASIDEHVAQQAAGAGVFANRTRALHIGQSFADVPTASLFYPFVETILHNGVTGGCGPDTYCLSNNTLRKQMAVFLLKALNGSCYVPPAATGIFGDVPQADTFAPWIEDLYNRGITGGCSPAPLLYCPNDTVKRQQMAVFLLKTKEGSAYTPPAAVGIFPDVPPAGTFAPWIEELFNRGIAAGCGGGLFCPGNSVNRGQMAPFLTKTFGLLLYAP